MNDLKKSTAKVKKITTKEIKLKQSSRLFIVEPGNEKGGGLNGDTTNKAP
jgi:hypothetical protein